MSGSNSSGRAYMGVFSIDLDKKDCDELKSTDRVISPTMSYFNTVSKNTILKIVLSDSIVVLEASNGDEVGSLNPTWIIRLKECLEEGYKYEAQVHSIDGAAIYVQINCLGKS
jgi:hypothetical protein